MKPSYRSATSVRAGAFTIALVVFAASVHAQFLRMPQPGDVFRDYGRTMNGNRDWRVTDPNATAPGAAESLPNPILDLSVADLQGATRAELVIDFWGGHPGTQPRQFRFNGNAWITIPNLATVPTSRPNCFMQQVNFVVDVPLTDLVEGTNTLEGTSGGQICNNFNWGQWGWYQVIVRVYYDPASKPHPVGAITSPSDGATFGENPVVTASASSSAGVSHVDFFAYLDGYDPDGDGRYADWQVSYHRLPSDTVPRMSEHVGSDATEPYTATWNTSLVPDQSAGSVKLIAHVRDVNGYVYVTNEVPHLTLQRTTSSVRLYRGVGVPEVFWVRNNQTKNSYFVIPSGDNLANATAAHLLIRSWNARQSLTTLLVNSWIAPLLGQNHHYSYDKPTLPTSALLPGLNTFTVSSTETEHHGTEIMWPGPALLVRYDTPPRAPTAFPALLGCDETTGDVIADATGNGTDGLIVPGATRTTDGRFGNAIAFDGTSGHVDLDVIEFPGSALTVSLWAYVDSATHTDARLFAKGLSGATLDGYCTVALSARNRVRFRLATATGTTDLLSGAVLTLDAWNHVAVTYDGAFMRIFVNGVQKTSVAKTGAVVNGSNAPAWLGDNPGPDRRRLTGRIDEVRVYAVAQTSIEITNDMNTAIGDADVIPPTAPANLVAVADSPAQVSLSWSASIDDVGVTSYRVYRDNVFVVSISSTTAVDEGLSPDTSYAYVVRAVDAAGNESEPSNTASVTMPADTEPPTAPQDLTATALSSASVALGWTASTDNAGIAYYRVFRDGVQIATPTDTTYTDLGVSDSTSYNYVVRAVDVAGNESEPSNTATVTTPAPSPLDPDMWLGMAFEEETGTSAFDSTANANDGTLTTGAARTESGKYGRALELSGDGGRVDLGALDITGSAFTIACWFFADDFGISDARLISKATGVNENDHYWMLSTIFSSGIKPRLRLKTTSGNTTTLIGSITLSTGVWTHLAATYDGAMMRLFVNGVAAGSLARSGSIVQNPSVPAAIGDQPQGTKNFDGRVDEVRIYTRALTATELQTLMNEPLPAPGGEPDTTPPTAPADLVATSPSPTSIELGWTAATDDVGVAHYRIFRDDVSIGTTIATSHTDTSVAPATTYQYTVRAVDAAGNESADSNTASATTPSNTAPTISALADPVTNEDVSTGPTPFTIGDGETAVDSLSLTGVSSNPTLVPDSSIVFGGTGADRTLAVTPAPDQSGSATITVTVSDGELSASEALLLTVNPVNDAPTLSAIADQTIAQNTNTGSIPVAIGDVDTPLDSLTLSGSSSNTTLVPDASIAFDGTGAGRTVTVTPAAGQTGVTTITVTVGDGELSASRSFVLTVQPPAAAFVSDDFSAGALDTVLWTFVNPMADGSVDVLNNLLLIRVPGGVDHDVWTTGNHAPRVMQAVDNRDFEVEVKFESAFSQKYQMQGLIVQQDDANFLRIEVFFDGSKVRAFVASFINGSPSVVINKAISAASTYYLRVARAGSQWTYRYSYDGSTWTTAGTFTRDLAVAEVGVHAGNSSGFTSPDFTAVVDYAFNTAFPLVPEDAPVANTPPTITSLVDQVTDEDTAAGPLAFSIGDAETEADSLTLAASSLNPALIPDASIVFAGVGADRTVTATPLPDQAGSATISVTVADGALTTTESFVLTVNPVNDSPTLSAIAGQRITQDGSTVPISFTVADIETPAANLTLSGDSSNPTLVPAATIVFGGSGTDRTVTLTPAAGQSGTALITVTVSDAELSSSETFQLTVTAVTPGNTVPTISDLVDQIAAEDTVSGPFAFTIGDNQTATDSLLVTAGSADPTLVPIANIALGGAGADRTVTVTPAPDETGSTTITVSVSDGELTGTASFLFTVTPVNDPPLISAISEQTIIQDTDTGPISIAVGDIETAADSLVLGTDSSNPTLVPVANITIGGSGENRTLTVTPTDGETGITTITLVVTDGELSASTSFLLTVQPATPAFVSDDFSAPTLDAGLWTFVNPVGDGTVAIIDKTVHIHVPGGVDHDVWATGNHAPRVMQAVDNRDFEVEVKFESALSQKYQMQGLIVQQDDANFLRLEVFFDGSKVRAFVASFINGSPSVIINKAISAASTYYLRVARAGSQWTYRYSYDGSTWTTVGTFTRDLAVAEVGVHAGNGSGFTSPDFTAVVDYAFNTAFPLVPEDPSTGTLTTGVDGDGTVTKSPDQATYSVGDIVTLTATPAPGWHFAGWSGDASGTTNPLEFSIVRDHTIVAHFASENATAPTISEIADLSVDEDAAGVSLSFTVGDLEISPALLLVTGTSSDGSLVPDTNIVLGGSGANRTLTVTPSANQNGTATITLTVSDGELTASESFLLTVNAVNDPPTISSIADQTIDVDTSTAPIPFVIGDVDTALAGLELSGQSSNTALIPDANIAFAGSGADRSITVTPLAGQTGSATITLTVSDGALIATASFEVIVRPPTAAFRSDDFNRGTLDAGRWSFINPLGDAVAAINGNLLRIDVPGGTAHDAWVTLNAPRVMQAISNTDFGLEAKFVSLVQQRYQIQGLLIEQDAGNFLRFDVHHDGTSVRLFAAAFTNGSASVKLNTVIPAGSAYFLRVSRAGDQWTMSYSLNGTDWFAGATFMRALTVGSAGVFVGNSGDGTSVPAFTGFVDYVFNTASPIVPEDNGRLSLVVDVVGDGSVTRTPDETSYALGSTVQLTATAGAGSTFIAWRGDIDDVANPVTITADSDLIGTATFAVLDTTSNVIDVWYGATQTFGQPGVPQQWVNVLGNLVTPSEIAGLSYYLNGSYQGPLSVGPTESVRLLEAGDFNAEIDYTHLTAGTNQVMFVAQRFDGTVVVKATTVNFVAGNTWPLPYSIDWSAPDVIQDVAQITDGKWSVVTDGVRTTVRGYDRVLAIGDMLWTNYEVTVPFTIHSVNSNNFGAFVGVMTRWIGHFDWDGSQPRWGWHPNGAIGGIMWRSNSSSPLVEIQPNGMTADQSLSWALSLGTRYLLKMQVETQGTPNAPSYVHRLKLWIDGDPEPANWTLTRTVSSGLEAGSALLLAHNADVTFGNVSVQPLTP